MIERDIAEISQHKVEANLIDLEICIEVEATLTKLSVEARIIEFGVESRSAN